MSKQYTRNIGTTIILNTGVDLSAAVSLKILVRKPSGEEVTWDATLGPSDALGNYYKLQYSIQTGDCDESGFYVLHALVDLGTWSGLGESVKFKVYPDFQ